MGHKWGVMNTRDAEPSGGCGKHGIFAFDVVVKWGMGPKRGGS
jgi:hypothetical protein